MTELLLIRHGYSVSNEKGLFTGQTDVPLTEEGIEQAKRTAEYLSEHYWVNGILSSDLSRAFETARCFSEKAGIPVEKDERLREIDGGAWEGKSVAEIAEKYPAEYFLWKNDIGNCHPPEGEKMCDFQKRITDRLKEIAREREGKTIAVFTHACAIRVTECFSRGLPLSRMKEIPWVKNASVTAIDCDGGRFSLKFVGYAAHLASLQTTIRSF